MSHADAAVPLGWAETTLGEIAHVEAGQSPPGTSFTTDPAAIEFLQGNAEFGDLIPTPVKRTSEPAKFASANAVLLSVRAPVGATNLSPTRIAIGRGLMAVEPLADMDRRFLLWLLRYKRHELEAQATGTTFSAVTGKVVRSLPVLLPPLAEQEEIVSAVDRTFEAIHDGERSLSAALRRCDDLRASLLGELFAPEYPRKRLDEVGEVFLGFTPSRKKPDLWDGDVPWVASGEVAFGRITSTKETISETALGNRDRRLNPPGTVLLAMYGEGKTRGQAAILDIEAATNQAIAAIRLRPQSMVPEFLYYCLMAQYAAIRQVGQGGQQINLNGQLVRGLEVPTPSITQQRALLERLEARLAAVEALRGRLAEATDAIPSLRASVLHRAFMGQLTRQREDAGSADLLLQHIAAAAAANRSRSKRRAVSVGS